MELDIKDLVKAIKTEMNKREQINELNEESIKNHVVVPIFLNVMGYSSNCLSYELKSPDSSDRSDIIYKEEDKPVLLIETKGKSNNKDINIVRDCKQLIDYLNSTNIMWGILTNGTRYVLVNKNIQGTNIEKIVFDISIDKPRERVEWLKYFSHDNLLVNKATNFFADISQFKVFFLEKRSLSSWELYKSTLYSFFEYYISSGHDYNTIGYNFHEPLTRIRDEDFKSFINNYHGFTKGAAKSKDTINAKYSHFSLFFNLLKQHGYIPDHNLLYSRSLALSDFEETEKVKTKNYLNCACFKTVLCYYYSHRNNYRNILVFLLCAYYGIERSEILTLSWSNIDLQKSTLTINDREYKLNNLSLLCLNKMKRNQSSKAKCGTVIFIKSGKEIKSANAHTINDIFDSLGKIKDGDINWENFCPKYVKKCLAEQMFSNGFSLEEIIYYLNIKVKSIGDYIQEETIISEGMNRFNSPAKKPKHPFEQTCEEFYLTIKDD